jgi:hypothetical protein
MSAKLAVGFALAVISGTAMAASGVVETYTVNAQYRGGVKKGFQDLGTGKVSYESIGPSAFRVRVKGEVRHPDQNKEYTFNISERYQISGNSVRETAVEKKQLNEHAKPHEQRITELIPFAYLVRQLPAPADTGGDTSRALSYRGQQYTLRYRDTEKNREVELYRGESFLGKFFLEPGASGNFAKLEKFRLALPEEDLVVSFVVSDSYALGGGGQIME